MKNHPLCADLTIHTRQPPISSDSSERCTSADPAVNCHFIWFHSKYFDPAVVPPPGRAQVRFIVMNNVFQTALPIGRQYDLKGSTLGRTSGSGAAQAGRVLKDLDLDIALKLEEGWHERCASARLPKPGCCAGDGRSRGLPSKEAITREFLAFVSGTQRPLLLLFLAGCRSPYLQDNPQQQLGLGHM